MSTDLDELVSSLTQEDEDDFSDEIRDYEDDLLDENGELEECDRSDEIVELEENVAEEVEVEDSGTPSWSIPTSLIDENGILISEFDKYIYKFEPLIDPSNNKSDQIAVFCKKTNDENSKWLSMRGLLTSRYHIAHTQSFTEAIKSQFNSMNEKIITFPFNSIWISDTDMELSLFEDDIAKLLFSIGTGLDIKIFENCKTIISLLVKNSHNKQGKLSVRYCLRNVFNVNKKEYSFLDTFVLLDTDRRVRHSSKLPNIKNDIEHIEDKVKDNIKFLSNVNSEELYEIIMGSLRKKKEREEFNSFYQNLPESLRNVYYTLILASFITEKYPVEHISKSNCFITNYVNSILEEVEN